MTTLQETSRFADLGDADLIAASRTGESDAFAELFRRHKDAVRSVALRHVRNASDADDLTSEAFTKLYGLFQEGKGPDTFFRAYACTVVSRLAYAQNDRSFRNQLTAEPELFDKPGERYVDPVMASFESSVVSKAFTSLPERWRAVLWYSEVEDLKPAEIAQFLGLSPNGVSALLVRAREGLRNAYLQQHIVSTEDADCEPIAAMLGAYVRDGLGARNAARVKEHLETCERCSGLVAHLSDVGESMRGVVLPLYIGVAASFAPLALSGGAATLGGAAAAGTVVSGAAAGTAQSPAWLTFFKSPQGLAASSVAVIAAATGVYLAADLGDNGAQTASAPQTVAASAPSTPSSAPSTAMPSNAPRPSAASAPRTTSAPPAPQKAPAAAVPSPIVVSQGDPAGFAVPVAPVQTITAPASASPAPTPQWTVRATPSPASTWATTVASSTSVTPSRAPLPQTTAVPSQSFPSAPTATPTATATVTTSTQPTPATSEQPASATPTATAGATATASASGAATGAPTASSTTAPTPLPEPSVIPLPTSSPLSTEAPAPSPTAASSSTPSSSPTGWPPFHGW